MALSFCSKHAVLLFLRIPTHILFMSSARTFSVKFRSNELTDVHVRLRFTQEGAMTSGLATAATDALVQANIVAAGYGK